MNYTNKGHNFVIKYTEVKDVIMDDSFVIIFPLMSLDSDDTIGFISSLQSILKDKAKFYVLVDEDARKYTDKYELTYNSYVVYKDGKIYALQKQYFPNDDILEMLYRVLAEQKKVVINDFDQLLTNLRSDFSCILSRESNFEKAINLRKEFSFDNGIYPITLVSDELARYIGIKDKEFGFFRCQDNNIMSFKPNTKDLDEIYQANFPLLDIYGLSYLDGINVLFLIDQYTDEVVELAEKLSKKFPDLSIVFSGEIGIKFIQDKFGLKFEKYPSVYIINCDEISYLGMDNQNLDYKVLKGRIKSIINKQSIFLYPSEPIPKPTNESCQKLVGLNYFNTIHGQRKDLIIFYYYSYSQGDLSIPQEEQLQMFKLISNEFHDDNHSFYYIDTYKNGIRDGFPFCLTQPFVRIFPANKKSKSYLMNGILSRSNIIYYLKKYGTYKPNIEIPVMKKRELQLNLDSVYLDSFEDIPKEEVKNIKKYKNYLDSIKKKYYPDENFDFESLDEDIDTGYQEVNKSLIKEEL